MSTFGDRTAQQALLEWVEFVRDEFDLTKEELVIVMISVLGYINDPYDSVLESVRKNKQLKYD